VVSKVIRCEGRARNQGERCISRFLRQVDQWRSKPDQPSRAQAIERLVEVALEPETRAQNAKEMMTNQLGNAPLHFRNTRMARYRSSANRKLMQMLAIRNLFGDASVLSSLLGASKLPGWMSYARETDTIG
jgi:hypothetical protein